MKDFKKIAIFGAKGKMGSLFSTRAKAKGYFVVEFDLPLPWPELTQVISQADLILLCIPMPGFEQFIQTLSPYLQPEQTLMDVCSVKVWPIKVMEEHFSGPVIGSHPLFGPNPDSTFNKVALCPGQKGKDRLSPSLNFWTQLGFKPFLTTPQEHDKAMAFIQGLNFITTLTYFASESGEHVAKFITPSFARRMEASFKMIVEDFNLFANMVEHNPYSGEMVRQFRSFLSLAAAGELEVLAEKSLWWWKNFKDQLTQKPKNNQAEPCKGEKIDVNPKTRSQNSFC